MTDAEKRERLIRAMEYCTADVTPVDENDECLGDVCPFKEGGYESGDCQENMIRAALALLKEQEPVKYTSRTGSNGFSIVWTCGSCGADLHPNNAKAKYCSQCGKAVKWDE